MVKMFLDYNSTTKRNQISRLTQPGWTDFWVELGRCSIRLSNIHNIVVQFKQQRVLDSRKQTHVLLFRKSDFLIFKVSNSNMPQIFFRKKTFLFVVRMSWNFVRIHDLGFHESSKISANSDNKQKSFVPKKKLRHVTIRDFKKQKIRFSE